MRNEQQTYSPRKIKRVLWMRGRNILLAIFAFVSTACDNHLIEESKSNNSVLIDKIRFTYYLTDTLLNPKTKYSPDEWIIIHLNIENTNMNDTVMTQVLSVGECYNSNNQFIEKLSLNALWDTIPIYKKLNPNNSLCFTQAYYLSVPTGEYHYQNPQVSFYFLGKETDKKELILPLTIYFQVH